MNPDMKNSSVKQKDGKPLVSFIITYHDEAMELLIQSIDSVLSLSLSQKEREIIIVDDGSVYCPMNDLLNYGDDIVYIRKKNEGASVARNTGLLMASGTFIQFVDADDHLIASAYEHCLDIARYKNPDIVMFDYTRQEPGVEAFCEETGPMMGSEFMRHNNLRGLAWCYLFRRDILHNLRFTPGIVHEDEEFVPLLVLRSERFFYVPAKSYFYLKRPTSVMGRQDVKSRLRRLDDKEKIIFKLYYMADRLPAADRLALQRRTDQLTMDYLYDIIVQSRSSKQLEERIGRLRKLGQFPLPDRRYTKKYVLFRRMANSGFGRKLMLACLPLYHKLSQ